MYSTNIYNKIKNNEKAISAYLSNQYSNKYYVNDNLKFESIFFKKIIWKIWVKNIKLNIKKTTLN